MSKQDNLTDFLTDVADAIREKKGTTDLINPQDFSDEIRGIESGGGGMPTYMFGSKMEDDGGRGSMAVTEIAITNTKEISDDAFANFLSLKKVVVPDDIIKYGYRCFNGCTSLSEIDFPQSIEYIEANSFNSTKIDNDIVVPNLKRIGVNALNGTNIKSFIAVNYTNNVQSGCMANCASLTKISIPHCIYIGAGAFENAASLVDIGELNKVTTIEGSFKRASLKGLKLNFPALTKLNYSSFSFTKIHGIDNLGLIQNMGADVSNTENGCFAFCDELAYAIMPSTLTRIGRNTFRACTSLQYVDFRQLASIPQLGHTEAFAETTCQFVVPDNLYDDWITATNWNTYASRIVKASEFVEPTTE